MLSLCCLISIQNCAGSESLCDAAQSGNEKQVRDLINRARTANKLVSALHETNWVGWTPLQVAANCGYDTIVQLLLQAGADANSTDNNGSTPLQEVVFNRKLSVPIALKIIAELIKAGANVNMRDKKRWTALCLAATRPDSAPLITALKAAGAEDPRTNPGQPIVIDDPILCPYDRFEWLGQCPF